MRRNRVLAQAGYVLGLARGCGMLSRCTKSRGDWVGNKMKQIGLRHPVPLRVSDSVHPAIQRFPTGCYSLQSSHITNHPCHHTPFSGTSPKY